MSNEIKKMQKNVISEQEVDEYLAVRKKINNPVDHFKEEEEELTILESRVNNGEKIDVKDLNKVKEKIERKSAKLALEGIKAEPSANVTLGKAEYLQLTKDANCHKLATYVKDQMGEMRPMEEMLTDQFIAAHRLSMKLLGIVCDHGNEISAQHLQQLSNMSMRMMDVCQRGAQTIHKLHNGGQQTVIVKHQNVQVNDGGQAIVANEFIREGAGDGDKK